MVVERAGLVEGVDQGGPLLAFGHQLLQLDRLLGLPWHNRQAGHGHRGAAPGEHRRRRTPIVPRQGQLHLGLTAEEHLDLHTDLVLEIFGHVGRHRVGGGHAEHRAAGRSSHGDRHDPERDGQLPRQHRQHLLTDRAGHWVAGLEVELTGQRPNQPRLGHHPPLDEDRAEALPGVSLLLERGL